MRYILGWFHPARGRQTRPGSRLIAGLVFGALNLNRTGSHAVHRDAIRRELDGRYLREHLDTALARRVIHQTGKRDLVAPRSDVDDAPTAAFAHVARRELRAQEAA